MDVYTVQYIGFYTVGVLPDARIFVVSYCMGNVYEYTILRYKQFVLIGYM